MTEHLSKLHKFIVEHYDLDELYTLCFDLGVDYDELGVGGKSVQVQELLLYLGHRQRLDELLDALHQSRAEPFDLVGFTRDSKTLHALYAGLPAWEEGIERKFIDRFARFFRVGSEEQRALRNRRAMLELVKNIWVIGVLEQSIHSEAMIDLDMKECADAVEHPWDVVLQRIDRPNHPLPRNTKILDVYDETNRALLILGEPGSGKTTTLLELARDTITRAEAQPTQPLPVVLNLSSWAEKGQRMSHWVVDELNTRYNIPKRIGRSWVENEDLLLLLDGLDEVKLERREDCVRAINDFRRQYGLTPLVVCSRTADYATLTTQLKLQGAVVLQPLTPKQVDTYLKGAGIGLLAVRRTLQSDTTLQELARSPMMLSIMTLAYRGMPIQDLQPLDSVEARRKHVFCGYVQQMLERRGGDKRYSSEKTIRWLAWLAAQLSKNAQAVFTIDRMQPTWLQKHARRLLYFPALFLVGGLMGGLAVWLTGVAESLFWLIGGLIGACLFLFGSVRKQAAIKPVEVLKWSWKGWIRTPVMVLIAVLIVLLFVGVISIKTKEPSSDPWQQLVAAALFLLVAAVFVVLFNVLFLVGLMLGLSYAEIETRTVPNQAIRQSAKNAVLLWLIPCIISVLVAGAMIEPSLALMCGLMPGLFFGALLGLRFGGLALIQHFTLRFTLCFSGKIPWNLVRFLDHASELVFLRKVGGGYIFIHRLLQDHFASLDEEDIKRLSRQTRTSQVHPGRSLG